MEQRTYRRSSAAVDVSVKHSCDQQSTAETDKDRTHRGSKKRNALIVLKLAQMLKIQLLERSALDLRYSEWNQSLTAGRSDFQRRTPWFLKKLRDWNVTRNSLLLEVVNVKELLAFG